MKLYKQQQQPFSPLYKMALLLLFLFSVVLVNAQSFYYVKDTKITIDESTIFYVADSGQVNQARLRDFEGQNLTKNQPLNKTGQLAVNNKHSKLKKSKNQQISKSSKKRTEKIQRSESIENIKSFPSDFFSSYQKGIAISATASNIEYNSKFLIENTTLKSLQGYSSDTNSETINNRFLFLNDYHLCQYMTRPPPLELY
ncbi:hypothetical protein [Chryseobacterium ginsengisoli]